MSNALNLTEINQEQALNLTKFFIQSQQNILLMGQKGVGKSEISIQAIKECGYQLGYINLSVIERFDLSGLPKINDPGDLITYKHPHYLPKLLDGYKPNIVLLFDELDKCAPETTAPLLEILQFRKINGVPLNIVACILTANLPNERSYSNSISSTILDRASKYILTFDFNHWADWARTNDVHDLILGFLRSDPDFACGAVEDTTYASPSPRGWTWASNALSKAKELKMPDIESVSQIISGYVGAEAGMRFRIWYEFYRKFEPYVHSMIERGDMSFNFAELMPTEKIVYVITACHYTKQKVFTEKAKSRFVYLERLCHFFTQHQVDNEMQVMGLHNSFDFNQIASQKLYSCKIFFDHFTKLSQGVSFKK